MKIWITHYYWQKAVCYSEHVAVSLKYKRKAVPVSVVEQTNSSATQPLSNSANQSFSNPAIQQSSNPAIQKCVFYYFSLLSQPLRPP
jgi:hypothetical protein